MNKTIYLAGGCFWGVEEYFKRLKGVLDTKCVYINNDETLKNSTLNTFAEAVEITFTPSIITLETLFDHLFRIINPYTLNKQGADVGLEYRTGIYSNEVEFLNLARDFIRDFELENNNRKVKVEVLEIKNIRDAEDFHQNYLLKNPSGYCHIDFSKAKVHELK